MSQLALRLLLALTAVAASATVPYAHLRRVGDRVKCQCNSECSYTVGSCNMLGCHFREPVLEDIRLGLEEGKSDNEVLEAVYEKYGNETRVEPENRGFGRVGWFAPFVSLLAGLSLIFWVIRRWHRTTLARSRADSVSEDVVDRYRSRIEDDLEQLE